MNAFKTLWLGTALLALVAAPPAKAAQTSILQSPNPTMEKKLQSLETEIEAKGRSYRVGYSSAMERPIEELAGLREPEGWLKDAPVEPLRSPLAAQALPSSFDWRTQNGTTPIKDQRNCGDCWAFGTVAPLESQIQLQCNVTVDLSEQYLNSCNTDGYSCDGGWFAHDYHLDKPGAGDTQSGAVLESAFPYTASDAPCRGPYKHPYHITNWSYISSQRIPSVQAIKQAIYTYGPVAAAVYVGPKFQAYSSGIFDSNESGQINHAIALVGWNDDLGPDNGYWILRNSWGTGWGENGYMRIRYGRNQVGYAANYVEFTCDSETPPPPPALADLSGSVSRLSAYSGGHRIIGTIKVVNAGEANAGAFKTQLYLSDDGTTKTQYLGQAVRSGLAKGATANISFNKYSATTVFSGKYLLAILDTDSQVTESDESNNIVVKLIP